MNIQYLTFLLVVTALTYCFVICTGVEQIQQPEFLDGNRYAVIPRILYQSNGVNSDKYQRDPASFLPFFLPDIKFPIIRDSKIYVGFLQSTLLLFILHIP